MWTDLPDPHLPADTTSRMHFDAETGLLRIIKRQQVDGALAAIAALRDSIPKDRSLGLGARLVGSIPTTVAAQWAKECGHPIGTAGFAAYARRQLMSGAWERLRVHGD